MARDPRVARDVWRRLEPIHAVTYFSPEPLAALADAGYKGFWMGYFAGRAAPLGPVGPDVVRALFYNFAPSQVTRALPDAWAYAAPEVALRARLQGSVAALRRLLGAAGLGDDAVAEAAELAATAARTAPVDGRVLFAANAALPWPDEPLEVLWHAATLLREHRGDGHVALLVTLGVSGRECNVLQAAAGNVPDEMIRRARAYDDAEWSAVVAGLAARGLLTPDGALTAQGAALRDELEARTDAAALSGFDALTDDQLSRLIDLLTPIAKAVVAGGDIPPATPMGPTLH
jgi:hypothetical protein